MASPKNKISGFYEYQQNVEQWNYGQGALGSGGVTSPEAQPYYEVEPHYFIQSRWTNPLTSRVLLEAGATYVKSNFQTTPQQENALDLPAIREIRTNTTWRNRMGTYGQNPAHNFNTFASMSYVTGSHTFKAGALFINMAAHTTRESTGNGTALQLLDGVPSSVVVYATPLALDEKLKMQLGFFAQDNWKIKRATIYMGLRYDNYNAYVPEQTIGPGPWTPTRNTTYAKVPNVPNWKDFSPRFGVSYDLFGTGRTALKGTLNRYLFGPDLIVFTRLANPIGAIATSATRTWTDANGDFVPQESELGALSARDFGSPIINTRYDSDVLEGWGKRGDNWEVSLGIQHELVPRVGVSAAYFRRWWGNLHVTQNRAVTSADFDPYCITAPVDARLPGGGGNQICGLYDVSAAKFGLTDNLITFADNFGKQTQVYDGVDLSMNARFPNGALDRGRHQHRAHADQHLLRDGRPVAVGDRARHAADGGVLRRAAAVPDAVQVLRVVPAAVVRGSRRARPPEHAGPDDHRQLHGPQRGDRADARPQPLVGRQRHGHRAADSERHALRRPAEPGGFPAGEDLHGGHGRLQAAFDLYNLFNDNPVISMNNTFGSAWQRPTVIQVGRLAKFGHPVQLLIARDAEEQDKSCEDSFL